MPPAESWFPLNLFFSSHETTSCIADASSPSARRQTAVLPALFKRSPSDHSFSSRVLGSAATIDPQRLLTPHQLFVSEVIATVCSSASVLAALVFFYWFAYIRKRFRHKLILLLIFGSLVRSVWYLVYATVNFSTGVIQSHSTLCQASGFLVSFGTEMNDFAALFIALHSALQVYRPQVSSATSDGLYNYRYYIYAINILVPLLMASLAFIDSSQPYLSQGPLCSLPIRPIWYRLALSWIPRYMIWLIIFILSISIYVHVGFQFRSHASTTGSSSFTSEAIAVSAMLPELGRDIEAATVEFGISPNAIEKAAELNRKLQQSFTERGKWPTPLICPTDGPSGHDELEKTPATPATPANEVYMFDDAPSPMTVPGLDKTLRAYPTVTGSPKSDGGQKMDVMSAGIEQRLQEAEPLESAQPSGLVRTSNARRDSTGNVGLGVDLNSDIDKTSNKTEEGAKQSRRPSAVSFALEEAESSAPAEAIPHTPKPPLPRFQPFHRPTTSFAKYGISRWDEKGFNCFHDRTPSNPRNQINTTFSTALASQPTVTTSTALASNLAPGASRRMRRLSLTPEQRLALLRQRIRRQLRLMILYPLIYVLMWLIPFILHCMQYNDHYAAHPPFPLTALTVLCLNTMGLVDCIVFALREKPWKHIRSSDGSFWGSFKCRSISAESGANPNLPSRNASLRNTQLSTRRSTVKDSPISLRKDNDASSGSAGSRDITATSQAVQKPRSDSNESNPNMTPNSPLADLEGNEPSKWWWNLVRLGKMKVRTISDAQRAEADRAYERLAREQAERLEWARAREEAEGRITE